jgi:endonuclease/exonuclease/phosphatase family metal-dependent hydrolase
MTGEAGSFDPTRRRPSRDRRPDPVFIGPVAPPDLHVMTYNIRRRFRNLRAGSPDRWDVRRRLLRRILIAEQPSVLGVQEALADQVAFVAESLGPDYEWVGRGREAPASGEACPVFYDARRLQLSAWRQRALSATPETPGSRSWGNLAPRVVVSAAFTDRSTGRRLVVHNTHFDHLSSRSRLASARMLRGLASAELEESPQTAVVVMGDLNAGTRAADASTSSSSAPGWTCCARAPTPSASMAPRHPTMSPCRP